MECHFVNSSDDAHTHIHTLYVRYTHSISSYNKYISIYVYLSTLWANMYIKGEARTLSSLDISPIVPQCVSAQSIADESRSISCDAKISTGVYKAHII